MHTRKSIMHAIIHIRHYAKFDHACYNAYTRYSIMHDIMHMRNSIMHATTHTRNSIMHDTMHMRIKLYMLQEQHCNFYTCYKSNIAVEQQERKTGSRFHLVNRGSAILPRVSGKSPSRLGSGVRPSPPKLR